MGFHVVKCPLEGLSGAFGGKPALLAPDRNPTRFPEEPKKTPKAPGKEMPEMEP